MLFAQVAPDKSPVSTQINHLFVLSSVSNDHRLVSGGVQIVARCFGGGHLIGSTLAARLATRWDLST